LAARIVVTHRIFPDAADRLGRLGTLAVNTDPEPWPRDVLLKVAAEAEAMLAFMTDRVDEALLAACPRLKIVAGALKGADNFDAAACARHGVWLTAVPDLLTAPTAELAVALLLGLGRHLTAGDALVRGGRFAGWRPVLYGAGLDGATVGLAGLGRVGLATAARLAGFGCALVGFDIAADPAALAARAVTAVGFAEMLERSDAIVAALPLRPDTLHLFGAAALARTKPGARLVNVGRGSVVDEAAVAEALLEGRLAGYAADVFEFEDWARADRPREVPARLRALTGRTLFTPHLGSAVTSARRAIEMAAVENIEAALAGRRPPGAINEPAKK
jgi:phosphonate dehydrogenase